MGAATINPLLRLAGVVSPGGMELTASRAARVAALCCYRVDGTDEAVVRARLESQAQTPTASAGRCPLRSESRSRPLAGQSDTRGEALPVVGLFPDVLFTVLIGEHVMMVVAMSRTTMQTTADAAVNAARNAAPGDRVDGTDGAVAVRAGLERVTSAAAGNRVYCNNDLAADAKLQGFHTSSPAAEAVMKSKASREHCAQAIQHADAIQSTSMIR